MNSTVFQFEYMGFQYRTYSDIEDDNIKIFHYCFKDGEEVDLPYAFYNHSPYSLVSEAEFRSFVDNYVLLEFVDTDCI